MLEILRVEGVTKRFSGATAVDDVSFSLNRGEVLAILGGNGAGKSTITKIICGALPPDTGSILLNGARMVFKSPYDASIAGIRMVYQELTTVGGLSVAENIFMNSQPVNRFNKIQWQQLYANAEGLLQKFNLDISPKTLVKRLSIGQQQLLEILKALSSGPKVLILDEPTSSLTEVETNLLFDNIRELKREGVSFIYITHKLSEIFDIADGVLVMRDGKLVGSRAIKEASQNELVTMMVGREINRLFGEHNTGSQLANGYYFTVDGFRRSDAFHDISFGVRRGEIVGIAGMVGAGRTELAKAIFGADRKDEGTTCLDGAIVKINSPADAIKHGIVYLTEDRKKLGLYLNHSVKSNLIAPNLKSFTNKLGVMQGRRIRHHATMEVKKFTVACSSPNQKIGSLSGGNQQKVLISMWMGVNPQLMILDEPTRGVDVGARSDIYSKIREYVSQGCGAIIISSEVPELIGLCDRILVMHEGRITGEVAKQEFSEQNILAYATGAVTSTREISRGAP